MAHQRRPLIKRFTPLLALSVMALLLAAPLEGAKKKKKKGNKQSSAYRNEALESVFGSALPKAKLDRNQQAQLTRLLQGYWPQLQKAEGAIAGVYTREQRKTLERARQMAIRAGTPSQNVPKRVQQTADTFELSSEQQAEMTVARSELAELKEEVRMHAGTFLKAEQLRLLFPGGGGKKKKK